MTGIMQASTVKPEGMVLLAIEAMQTGNKDLFRILDALPAAIYLTNPEGLITYYNRACTALTGRKPRLGRESWCVAWKLYTQDGEYLPHDRCPMAVAIRERRAIRGVQAVAERPDGSHVDFRPYPTPLLDEEGNLLGAANLLEPVSVRAQADALRRQAARYRRFVNLMPDRRGALISLARENEEKASRMEQLN